MSALTHEYRAGSAAADKELQFVWKRPTDCEELTAADGGEAAYLTLAKSWYTQIQPQKIISGMSRDTADLQLSPSD
jgi:hypothetical protein